MVSFSDERILIYHFNVILDGDDQGDVTFMLSKDSPHAEFRTKCINENKLDDWYTFLSNEIKKKYEESHEEVFVQYVDSELITFKRVM